MEPWEEYSEVWPTKASFFNWLRGRFREAVWNRFPGKIILKSQVCKPPPEDYEGKAKSGAPCSLTGIWTGKSKLEVDHIQGGATLKEWSDIEPFIRHLCAPQSNLQVVSKEAHKIKSYAERMGITFEEAKLKKQVIAFSTRPAKEQIKTLTELVKDETILNNAKNAADRKNLYREYLKGNL